MELHNYLKEFLLSHNSMLQKKKYLNGSLIKVDFLNFPDFIHEYCNKM